MSTVFDGVRALREEIEGLMGVRTTVVSEERRAQEALGQAEVHYNNIVKLRGFADAELARKRRLLRELEDAGK